MKNKNKNENNSFNRSRFLAQSTVMFGPPFSGPKTVTELTQTTEYR